MLQPKRVKWRKHHRGRRRGQASGGATVAFGTVKALFDIGWQHGLEDQLDQETDFIADIGLTQDFQEGIRAFSEKRRPGFQGK